jgi:membrane protease YdiL (CAAX protease family)
MSSLPPPPPPPVGYAYAPQPPTTRPPLAGREKRIARVELVVMLFAVAGPGLVIGLRGISEPTSVDPDLSPLTLVATAVAALGPAALALYLLWRNDSLAEAGLGRPRPGAVIGWGLLAFLSCIGAVFLMGIVIVIVQAATGHTTAASDSSSHIDATVGAVVGLLVISIVAGISEEITYRAYGITRMEEAGWPRAALVVPWAVWTAQHLYEGPIALLVVGAVGVPLVLFFRARRTVYPLIVGHALYDIAIFAIVLSR